MNEEAEKDSLPKRSKRKILLNYAKTYIFMLLVIIVLTSITFFIVNNFLDQQVSKMNSIIIENARREIDNQLEALEEISLLFNGSDHIEKLVDNLDDRTPSEIFDGYEMMKYISSQKVKSSLIEEIYVLTQEGEIVSSTFYLDTDTYYKMNEDFIRFESLILQPHYRRMESIEGIDGDRNIYVLYSLPLGSKTYNVASIVFELNTEYLFQLIDEYKITEGTEAFIMDNYGNILITLNTNTTSISELPREIKNGSIIGNNIVFVSKSQFSDLYILYKVSIDSIKGKVADVQNVIIALYIIIIIAGLGMVIYFSYKNYYPTLVLLNKAHLDGIGHNLFESIGENIQKVYEENSALKDKISAYGKMDVYEQMRNIALMGALESSNEDSFAEAVGQINRYLYIFYSIGIKEGGQKNWDNMKSSLARLTGEHQAGYVFIRENNEAVILLQIVNMKQFNKMDFANKIVEALWEMGETAPAVGVGTLHKTPGELKKALFEADKALEYKYLLGLNKIIDFEKIKKRYDTNFHCPLEMQEKIINYLNAGCGKEAVLAIESIIDANAGNDNLSVDAAKIASGIIISMIIKASQDIEDGSGSLSEAYSVLSKSQTVMDFKSASTEIVMQMSRIKKKAPSNKSLKLFHKIEAFIESNYSDNNMDRGLVCERFNLSKGYFSRQFKEQMGLGFNEFINKLRISRAKMLLLSTNQTIRQIASNVGYTNSGTLIRVFTKIEGITPGEYRNNADI